MKPFVLVALALHVACVTGCASIVSKSAYPVAIRSRPQGADFIIKEKHTEKEVHRGKTPTTVVLHTKAGFFRGKTYTVDFAKAGFDPYSLEIKPSIDGWYFGNIVFGGLIGLLIVDPLTGALYAYAEDVSAELSPQRTASAPVQHELRVVLFDAVAPHLRSHLVRVN